MDAPHPWDSTYQYQCKKKMFEKHRAELGDERAVSLANVWANYHFLGRCYMTTCLLLNGAINSFSFNYLCLLVIQILLSDNYVHCILYIILLMW